MFVIKVMCLFIHNKKIYAFIKETYTDAKQTAAYDEASDEFCFITTQTRMPMDRNPVNQTTKSTLDVLYSMCAFNIKNILNINLW